MATSPTTVTLSWKPGFDGGYNQTFVVTVFDQKTEEKIKDRTLEANKKMWWINGTTVGNLKPHTSYIIKVHAKNKAGLSEIPEEVFVKTRAIEENVEETELLPRVVIVTIVLLVLLGVLIVGSLMACCCIRHRRKTASGGWGTRTKSSVAFSKTKGSQSKFSSPAWPPPLPEH